MSIALLDGEAILAMESPQAHSHLPTPRFGVPDNLLGELHDANEHYRAARQHLEEAMRNTLPRHQERVDQAGNDLRQAEQHVEETAKKISESLPPAPAKPS